MSYPTRLSRWSPYRVPSRSPGRWPPREALINPPDWNVRSLAAPVCRRLSALRGVDRAKNPGCELCSRRRFCSPRRCACALGHNPSRPVLQRTLLYIDVPVRDPCQDLRSNRQTTARIGPALWLSNRTGKMASESAEFLLLFSPLSPRFRSGRRLVPLEQVPRARDPGLVLACGRQLFLRSLGRSPTQSSLDRPQREAALEQPRVPADGLRSAAHHYHPITPADGQAASAHAESPPIAKPERFARLSVARPPRSAPQQGKRNPLFLVI